MKRDINPTKDKSGLSIGSEENASDLTIIARIRQGDRAAFSILVRKYQKSVLRMALRIVRDLETAEDVVQETFLKTYQKLHLFEGRAAFKSWLFQISINTAKNKLRGKRHEALDISKVNIAVSPEAESDLEGVDLKEALNQAIDELPERQKMALVLRVYEDLSFKEVAQIMECPYDTAKANYRHALIKLKSRISDKNLLTLFNRKDVVSSLGFVSHTEGIEQ
ncbi:MAG: hypothetical protein A4S09_04505 [Proteobacteria bacterium SG_bin7]|nr:MAG: hypothetical protein A4S09_04505 [Proteobacteria bacterium SG_bin7]